MDKTQLGTVAIIGIGLIGGSLAKALKKNAAVEKVVALDSSLAAAEKAVELGVADKVAQWDDLVSADIIVLATPVDALYEICQKLATLSLKESVVITDVGSTKGSVLQAMKNAYGEVPINLVPAHPIAGREKSGVTAAETNLFVNHKVILTTLANTDSRALGVVSRMWLAVGASITYMSSAEHDEVLGATSHLPHILAYLLVDMLDQDLRHEEIFQFAAGGFRDFTRIASSSPVMWRDICLHNPDVLHELLDQYKKRISQFEKLLADGDGEAIETLFHRAKTARDLHYQKEQNL